MQQSIELTIAIDAATNDGKEMVVLKDSQGKPWILISKDALDIKLAQHILYGKKLGIESITNQT